VDDSCTWGPRRASREEPELVPVGALCSIGFASVGLLIGAAVAPEVGGANENADLGGEFAVEAPEGCVLFPAPKGLNEGALDAGAAEAGLVPKLNELVVGAAAVGCGWVLD